MYVNLSTLRRALEFDSIYHHEDKDNEDGWPNCSKLDLERQQNTQLRSYSEWELVVSSAKKWMRRRSEENSQRPGAAGGAGIGLTQVLIFFFTKINRFFIWFCLHRLDQLYQFNFIFLTKSTLFFRYNIFQAQTPFLKTKKI